MPFKYQALFDEFHLTDCPASDHLPYDGVAYRWCHFPLEHDLNFLPNVEYSRKTGKAPRILHSTNVCGLCAISLFTSREKAIEKYQGIRAHFAGRPCPIEGYTHLGRGEIAATDGLASPISHHHFNFYENEGINLKTKFTILEVLNA